MSRASLRSVRSEGELSFKKKQKQTNRCLYFLKKMFGINLGFFFVLVSSSPLHQGSILSGEKVSQQVDKKRGGTSCQCDECVLYNDSRLTMLLLKLLVFLVFA